MNNHKDFILTPITDILKNVVSASAGIGSGIETYPICDYIMQSTFLKMTGFQEQKMKCICWELATNDYQYRYEFTKNPLGECSNHKEKQIVFKDLIKEIDKCTSSFNVTTGIDKLSIITTTNSEIKEVFSNTILSIWAQNRFNEYFDFWNEIQGKHFATDKNTLLSEINGGISLKKIYDDFLYKHRNRCAHNTQSYQQNLPTLKTLVNEDYKYENYFLWFAILVIIDKIFMVLYEKYLDALKEK